MMYSRVADRFAALSPFKQSLVVAFFALLGAETLAALMVTLFSSKDLVYDLISTAAITVVVAVPISYFFFRQQEALARLAKQMEMAARIDSLTGLLNRGAFFTEVKSRLLLEEAAKSALLFIDADKFKELNDTHGHAAGDMVLGALGREIAGSIRERDVAGRLGGEEFAVFLPGANESAALTVARRIRDRSRTIPDKVGHPEIEVSVSIGISMRREGEAMDSFLKRADGLLYSAKRAGRDRIYTESGEIADGDLAA